MKKAHGEKAITPCNSCCFYHGVWEEKRDLDKGAGKCLMSKWKCNWKCPKLLLSVNTLTVWWGLKKLFPDASSRHPTSNFVAGSVCAYLHPEDFAKWLVFKISGKTSLYISELVCNLLTYFNYLCSRWDWRVLSFDCQFGFIQCNLFWGLTITSTVHSSPISRPDLGSEILWSLTAITPAPLAYPSSGWLLMLGAGAIIAREATISLKQHIWNRNV